MAPTATSTQSVFGLSPHVVGGTLTERVQSLRGLLDIISHSGEAILAQWEAASEADSGGVPSMEHYTHSKNLLGAAGMLSEVVQDPGMRCLQMCGSFFEARALHIAVRARVPQLLAASPKGRMTAAELTKATGIEHRKLARILRLLATNHMLAEVDRDTFSNNRISAHLIDNAGLTSYIIHYGEEPYQAAGALMYKLDTPQGASYDILDAPFSDVYGRKPRWEWLEEPDEKTGKPREQLARFGLAMLGAGDVEVPGVLADYKWAELGEGAVVVDVGGGVGQMCIALGRAFPNLCFVVQDRPPVIEQGEQIWKEQASELLSRCTLQGHDFFQVQPLKDASVYLLRHVVHDWADKESIEILKALKPALGPHSRILLAEQIMVCASGDTRIPRPPAPLPANWGDSARFSHQRDINMMGLINGIERSPAEFDDLVQQAGLVVKAFHPCRSQIGLVEIGLP